LHFLNSISAYLGAMLSQWGGWGLAGINLLDSSFLGFPLINDLLLIHLSGQHPHLFPVYAMQATLGSVAGSYIIYVIARASGELLARKQGPRKRAGMWRAHQWLERNEVVTLMIGALLPPPTPYKIFPASAGILRVNAWRFGLALGAGRLIRFGIEGFVGARYGPAADVFVKTNLVWIALAMAVAIVAVNLLMRHGRGRPAGESTFQSGSERSI
jgi:membrane protein YqaA with SNARE-associated domain